MLVLSRLPGEVIVIAETIKVTVLRVRGDRIDVAIDAPKDVRVRRMEVPPDSVKEKKPNE